MNQDFSQLIKIFASGNVSEIAAQIDRLNSLTSESTDTPSDRALSIRAQVYLALVFRERGDASIDLSEFDDSEWMGLIVPSSFGSYVISELANCFEHFLDNGGLPEAYRQLQVNISVLDFLDELETEFENDGCRRLEASTETGSHHVSQVSEQLEARVAGLVVRAIKKNDNPHILSTAVGLFNLIGYQEDGARQHFRKVNLTWREEFNDNK